VLLPSAARVSGDVRRATCDVTSRQPVHVYVAYFICTQLAHNPALFSQRLFTALLTVPNLPWCMDCLWTTEFYYTAPPPEHINISQQSLFPEWNTCCCISDSHTKRQNIRQPTELVLPCYKAQQLQKQSVTIKSEHTFGSDVSCLW
jgi:hypothetical protein